MKKYTLLSIVALTALPLTGSAARESDALPMHVLGLTGHLRIQQGVPCDAPVDHLTPITGGRLELTPAEGAPLGGGGRLFGLTRADLTFAGFSVSRSCLGISETRTYDVIRVQLARNATITGAPTPVAGVYAVSIPRNTFLMSYVTRVNGELEEGSKHPREDVTGTINLNTGAVQIRVVLGTTVTFRGGCVGDACLIDETHDGTLTADLTGTIAFPDVDADGVPDRADNCRFVANPDQSPVATPTVTAPTDVTLASCADRSFGKARAADVCDARPVAVTHNAPSLFPVGPTTVTWLAEDASGRTATDTQVVTVVDTTAPEFTFVPPTVTLDNCGPAALGMATATDDCAGAPAIANNAPPIFYVGTTSVRWTATDASGNPTLAFQSVVVTDTVAATVTCVPTSPVGNSFVVNATDACLGAPQLRLGGFALALGETIKINETGRSGVRLVNTVGPDGTRHFQVGRGEAVIVARDASGNESTVSCPVR